MWTWMGRQVGGVGAQHLKTHSNPLTLLYGEGGMGKHAPITEAERHAEELRAF